MNNPYIKTSQNVAIDYNLGDIGNRVVAKLLDLLFIGVYFFIFYLIFSLIIFNNETALYYDNSKAILMTVYFIIFLPGFFYSLWAPYFMEGQTFGKKIMKLKIVKEDGSEAGFGTYLARWLLNVVDMLFDYILGLIVMGSTKKRQRVADLVANTVVISTKQVVKVDQTILSEIEEDYTPIFSQVLQLSDRDVHIIKNALEQARATMDFDLVTKLRQKIEIVIQEYKPELTDIQYVETVLKDYQYFSQQ